MANDVRQSGNRSKLVVALAVAAIAVVVVVYFAVTGFPPSEQDTAGTVGAAKKYQATQMTEHDIILEDPEIQSLLQNDEFQKLIADKEFQNLMAHDGFISSVAQSEFQEMMLSQGFQRAMQDKEFAGSLQSGELQMLFGSDEFVDAIADNTFAEAIKRDGFEKAVMNHAGLSQLAMKHDGSVLSAVHEMDKLLQHNGVIEALQDDAFVKAARHDGFEKAAMKHAGLSKLASLHDGSMTTAIHAMDNMLAYDDVVEALQDEAFVKTAQHQGFEKTAMKFAGINKVFQREGPTSSTVLEMSKLMQHNGVIEALRDEAFVKTAKHDGFEKAAMKHAGLSKLPSLHDGSMTAAIHAMDKMLQYDEVVNALQDEAFVKTAQHQGLEKAAMRFAGINQVFQREGLGSAIRSTSLQTLMQREGMVELMRSAGFQHIMQNGRNLETMMHSGFQRCMKDQAFLNTIQKTGSMKLFNHVPFQTAITQGDAWKYAKME